MTLNLLTISAVTHKDRIDFFFDDKMYFSYEKKDVPPGKWAYDTPQYLLINLAIGDAWGGEQGIDNSIFRCNSW